MTYINCDFHLSGASCTTCNQPILSASLEEVQAAVCTLVGRGQYGDYNKFYMNSELISRGGGSV